MNNKIKKIIIATGGTGGHVFPAYSLAKHFIDKNINVQIISDKRGLRYLKAYNNLKIVEIASSTIFKKNIFKSLISILIFQTFIHIGVNANLLPTTGMTLPFLSYGGSSLIGSAVLAGIILNYTKLKLDTYE